MTPEQSSDRPRRGRRASAPYCHECEHRHGPTRSCALAAAQRRYEEGRRKRLRAERRHQAELDAAGKGRPVRRAWAALKGDGGEQAPQEEAA